MYLEQLSQFYSDVNQVTKCKTGIFNCHQDICLFPKIWHSQCHEKAGLNWQDEKSDFDYILKNKYVTWQVRYPNRSINPWKDVDPKGMVPIYKTEAIWKHWIFCCIRLHLGIWTFSNLFQLLFLFFNLYGCLCTL